MNDQDKNEAATLTIVEAVETLSNIADLEFDRNVGIAKKHDLIVQDKPLSYHTVHWLHRKDGEVTVDMVREIFRVILNYLRHFYKNEFARIDNQQAIEGIKTIMVLVGEAAKKLDKYTALFQHTHNKSVTELNEYKKLQEFYLNRIDRKIDEGLLGKWILALGKKKEKKVPGQLIGKKSAQTKHVFVDLESVKKDLEYELFFMRKEDGTRFFSPRLIRNLKLVSDFGDYFGEEKLDDPLLSTSIWHDRVAHACAQNIIRSTRKHIEKFYRDATQYQERDFIELLNQTFMALMLAANPHNLSHDPSKKNCQGYFQDFQLFLRQCLHSKEYQHLIAYPPQKSSKVAVSLLETIHIVCLALYTQMNGMQELLSFIHGLIHEAHEEDKSPAEKSMPQISGQLTNDYRALTKLLKLHPNGPINKILEALENGSYNAFDPLIQQNIPAQLYSLYVQDHRCLFARWPSPTHQEFVHKAVVIEEFKAFLRGCLHEHNIKKCLVMNLQDRGTWKEHYRCKAIEELQNQESFDKHIDVVTLAKETEFYHQLAPYHQENHADAFMKQFKAQFEDESCGFWFPDPIRKALLKGFIDEAMQAVHRIFFSGKNVLLREHRMDFIEIFYLFLELKIIDLVKPDIMGFCCKDGLDVSLSTSSQLFIFLKFLNQERLSEMDREQLELMLYGHCLLFRERVMLPERFNRMVSALKAIESVREHFGQANFRKIINEAFGRFYQQPILQGKLIMQSPHDQL